MRHQLEKLPLPLVLALALTLGLAPFVPEPHVWEKLKMLADARLTRPVDIFDLALHGLPWVILFAKIAYLFSGTKRR